MAEDLIGGRSTGDYGWDRLDSMGSSRAQDAHHRVPDDRVQGFASWAKPEGTTLSWSFGASSEPEP